MQWGVVNAAHPDFGGDVVRGVAWAQDNGYATAYIPAGKYELNGQIVIDTDHFTLLGAGTWSTVLVYKGSGGINPPYAVLVQPPFGPSLIEGVRLADFSV
jgi:hypothetical protein